MKRSLKKGLPGGPNEKVFSTDGYRSTSPDVNNPFNIIPSGSITMKEKDGSPLRKGPLMGTDNLGNSQMMFPGADYQFPGNMVTETPLAKKGGPFQNSNIYATNKLFAVNKLFKKRKKGKRARGVYNPKAKYTYQPGGSVDLPEDVGIGYLPDEERSYYNPLIDTVYLNPNASEEEFNHEMAHAWQNRQDGFRSDPYSPKLRPSTAASDEQAATYFNRKGDDVDRYINNLKTIVPELGGHTWNEDLDRFIPDQLKYDKVIDPLMYSDPSTLEGEAEYMSQVYGRPPLGIKKDGGAIEIEIDESDIDKYVKGGYVVEDISVPSLNRMQPGGPVPDSTYTPIDPNFLAENPDTYSQIVNKPEVTSERQGSDIGKLRAEFREKNPMDTFLDEKKRQFLKKNKGLNKAAGNTMEKFPEDVLQNFMSEYDYKTNNYAVNKLGKKEGWNPKRRGEWVDELTPGEKDAVAESKYGSKLQPSYWSRSLAGLQEFGNEAIKLLPGEQGDVMKYNIPGLTKKEQKEIRESKLGALETLAPMDIPGAAITNLVKNTGLSTGSDYKDLPGVLSGEKMSNVSDMEAMALNPLTYVGLEAIPELGINLAKGIGRGTLNLGKGLAKGIAGSEYTAGYSKLNSGLNTLGQKKALLNKKLVETAGKLPDSLIERRLWEFTNTNPRKRTISTAKELEKKLKVDLYKFNKLQKQHPNLDFNNPALNGYMFTNKEDIEKIPDILKTINQNEKSGKSLAGYVKKDFDNKIDFVRNSDNSVLKNIVDESPQYLDDVYTHLKNPKKTDEQFVNDLTIQSNTYTRFMKNAHDDSEYLNAVRGSNIDNTGYSMDVEGAYPSDWYGSYGYRIQPTIDRAMEIFQAPLAEKWGKRIPTFQGDMKMVPGMWTGLPENVKNALKVRNERINRNIVKSFEGEDMAHSIPIEYRFNNTIIQNLPEEFIQSKYYTVPQHQVFNSPKYGQTLEGFETIPLGKLQSPEIYKGYKDNEDYARFFEDTGKGFKEGGTIEINNFDNGGSKPKKDKWGRPSDSKWYGFDPKTKKWTLGNAPDWYKEPSKKSSIKKDKWGRPEGDKWYQYDPKKKGFIDDQGRSYEPQWRTDEAIKNKEKNKSWDQRIGDFVNQDILGYPSDHESAQQMAKVKPKVFVDPFGKKHTGHGYWDNYGDAGVQMVVPEAYVMGPGAGILGLAGRTAAKGISNLAKSSLIQGTKAALNVPIANIPGATIGNAISSGFAADALVNRLPEIPSQIAKGNYLGALENTATGVLDLTGANMMSPLVKSIGKGIDTGAKLLPEVINYGADVIGTSRNAGKLQLPKYKNVYRAEHSEFDLPAIDNSLTGRWFADKPEEVAFYVRKLKDPNTGEVIMGSDASVRILKKRLPEYKVNQNFGAGMPEEARTMSMGKGDLTDIQLNEFLGPGADRRFKKGVFTQGDLNSMSTAPFLYNPTEGILDPTLVNQLRKNSKLFEGKADAMKYLFEETEKIKNAKPLQSYLPFNKQGGVVSNLTKKEIDKLIKQGYIIEEID